MEFSEAERQRQMLEDNMKKLRQSLRHWQTWEAEYEGLKEEIIAAGPEDFCLASVTDIGKSYDGKLVTEKEVLVLAGVGDEGTASLRSYRQMLDVIGHRQEYVRRSIETVQRQFWVAEGKVEEMAFASFNAAREEGGGEEGEGEEGLPLTEIHEELDEEGNVLTSELRRPEQSAADVLERLRKAGLTKGDLGEEEQAAPRKSALVSPMPSPSASKTVDVATSLHGSEDEDAEGPSRPPIRKKSVSFTIDTKPPEDKERADSQEGRKSVTFNEKVAIARAADLPDPRSVKFSPTVEEIPAEPMGPPPRKDDDSTTQVRVNENLDRQQDLRASFKPGDKVYEINEETETTTPHFVLPENESDEDARLRRAMVEYNLNEVNHVVAQMDLDDDDDDMEDEHDENDSHSEFTASEYQDEDTPYTSGLSDVDDSSEDENGRSKHSVITDEYRKEMEALQQRLIGNLGSAPKDEDIQEADPELNPDDVRRLVISNKRASISSATSSASDGEKKAAGKKRVSFAEELDVAEAGPSTKAAEPAPARPIIEGVVERSPAPPASAPAPTPKPAATKTSRFKSARAQPQSQPSPDTQDGASDPSATPTGPPGIPMAETLLERTPTPQSATAPSADDDELDPVLMRRELAADYYRRRNDLVREQGGFSKGTGDEDEGLGELMQEGADGRVRKVSRFMAARLGK